MLYALIIVVVLALLSALLRLRVRLEFSAERRLLFVGLGHSGPEYDFGRKEGVLRLFGRPVKKFVPKVKPREAKGATKATEDRERKRKTEKVGRKKRVRSFRDILAVVRLSTRAVWQYTLGLLKSTIVEEAEGEIEAGFDSPDITGRVFGYYQAALAVSPSLVGRIDYSPNWTGRSLSGAVRLSVAWPIYRLVWQTSLLIGRLPVMKIIRLAIGTKEGVQDGK